MHRYLLPLSLLLAACSTTGPHRASLGEYLSPPVEAPTARALVPAAAAEPEQPAPAPSTPFSAGLMVGGGVYLSSGEVLPAQLAVGSCKVASLFGKRSLSILALGGISGTSVQTAKPAWGVGASVELTKGTLPYEVALALGALWVGGQEGGPQPAGVAGFTITPKM